MKGQLIVISGPSGCGKTTVVRELLRQRPHLRYSVSATTRSPRQGEVDGVDYWFLDVETFQQKIKENAFLEWAKVHQAYYGTPAEPIQKWLKENQTILLDLDVQGGLSIKRRFENAVLIFLLPPSWEELQHRLKKRGAESLEQMEQRLSTARHEIQKAEIYDFLIFNDQMEDTLENIDAILS